jgi:CO dehydrogenase nickel-insertion accessory protein CooC1|tara:strand:+ start:188 stop:406 length:219 start_codon:yes stop_codon:yes gene_type:complete
MRRAILNALRAKYEAEIAEADATANIYLDNSVGIGEHPQHIEEVDKLIEKIANAKEKIDVLEEFEPERGEVL